MILCPTYYTGDGTGTRPPAYNATLAAQLHPDVYLFWTGDSGVTPAITRRAAESFKRILKHRVILWDNYPVNNGDTFLNLGPLTGRDAGLCKVLDGYMSNPHRYENQLNRIPLLTCADYAYNPKAYDPFRSIGQAIVHLAETPEQRQALQDLVEAWPGKLIYGGNVDANPVRERFRDLASGKDSRPAVEAYLRDFEALVRRFNQAFPSQYADAEKSLDDNALWLKDAFAKQYQGAAKS